MGQSDEYWPGMLELRDDGTLEVSYEGEAKRNVTLWSSKEK